MYFKYYLAAIISFIIWGLFSLVLKPLSDYAAFDILTYRVAFAAIATSLISLFLRYKITLDNLKIIIHTAPSKRIGLILITLSSAVMLAMNWYFYIFVMNEVSVNATSLAYLICPILTTLLATGFLKEKLNRGQWVAVGLSLLSCLMLSYGHFMDLFYSLLIGLSYAIYLILQKVSNNLDKFFSLNLHILISGVILLPFGIQAYGHLAHSGLFYQYVFIIAVLFTIVPLFFNMYALKKLDSSVVGVLLYINPIIAFALAVLYFKEHISILQASAYGLIFLAVIIFNISYFLKLKKNS